MPDVEHRKDRARSAPRGKTDSSRRASLGRNLSLSPNPHQARRNLRRSRNLSLSQSPNPGRSPSLSRNLHSSNNARLYEERASVTA